MTTKAMWLFNSVGEWTDWLARRPNVTKKDGALRFGILGAANIGSVLATQKKSKAEAPVVH
jgi:hypothetical protein